jgi:hypothetical protein
MKIRMVAVFVSKKKKEKRKVAVQTKFSSIK